MSSRKSKKNQKLGSSRRNKNRNKDIEENEYDDGFPDPGNEKHDSEHSQFSTVSKNQESNEPAQFDSEQPDTASTSKTPSELSPHPQSYESKNLTGQAEVTSKKRKMGSTRKSNRELKFGGIYEDEPELGGQLCVEVIKEQVETVEVSIKEDSGKEDQTSLSDCAPSQSAEHESSILQGQVFARGTTMYNEDDHNNDEYQHLETAIQSKPMDSSSSESKEEEFGQDLIRTSLDFSIFTQTECKVPLQESDESLKICHQMDTFTIDHKSSIDTTTPLNENREEGQDVQMSLNNLIHNNKPSMVEQNVLKRMDDQSSLNYRREDVDTLDSCSAEEKNEITEVQSVALIDEHEHGTQDDKEATNILPNVITKVSTEDENKDEDHFKKNDDSLNITKESSYKSKSKELREDTDEYKEVSVLEDRNDNDSNEGVATTNLNQTPEPDRNISSPLKLEDQEVGTLSDQFLSNEIKFQAEPEIKYYREEQYNVSEANLTSESSADMVAIYCGEKKKYKQTGLEKEVENEDVQSKTSNQLLCSKVSSTNMSDFITESELISAERLYGETENSFQTHNLDHNNSGEFPIELESKDGVCSGQMFDNKIKSESLLLNTETEVIKEKNNDINEEINTDATESFTKEDFVRVDDEKDAISTLINEHEMISVITNRQDYAFTDQASMEVKEHGLESPDKGSDKAIDETISVQSLEEVTLISEDATLSFPSETCHQSSVSMNILEPEKINENMVNQDKNVIKDVDKNENTNILQEYIETPLHITTEVVNTDQERNVLDRQEEVTVMIKNICSGVNTTYVLSDVAEHLVDTEVLKMQRGTDVAESIVQNEEAESLDDPHQNNYSNFKLGESNPSECTDITINTDNLMAEPLDAAEDQINTVLLDEVSSVEGLLEQNEQPIVNEEKEAESTHLNEQEMGPIITKIQNDDFTEHVSLAGKMQVNESPDDEHASEVNAYTIHGPVELIPQTHTMSDMQMNTENIQIVGSDQNQNKPEEHLENFTKRESDLEPCQSTSAQQYLLCEVPSINTDLGSSTIEKLSPATEHPDFKEVDKNGIESQGNTDVEMTMQTKKRRKVGSTRRHQGRHQQTKEWKEEWKDLEHTEEIVHQIINQAATSILLTEQQNTSSEVSFTYDIHKSPMTIEQKETIKSEVQGETEVINTPPAMLSPEADQINTVVSHERSSVEGLSDVKEQNEKPGVSVKDDAESTLLNEQEMAPIITNITTTNYPTSVVENPDFKEDNVKTVENVKNKNTEIHTQTQPKKKKKFGSTRRPHVRQQLHAEGEDGEWKDPKNTEENEYQVISQAVSLNLLTEPQNTISEVSVDINDSNLTMEQKEIIKTEVEIWTGEIDTPPAVLSPEGDQRNTVVLHHVSSVEGLTDIKEQNEKTGVNEEKDAASAILNMQEIAPIITKIQDDAFIEHSSEVNIYTTCGPLELISQTHTMSDRQMDTENIDIVRTDQNQNISSEHLENLTKRESEPEPCDQTNTFQAIKEKGNTQDQNIEQKDINTGVTEDENNDSARLSKNVIKEDILSISSQQNVFCEISSLNTGLSLIKHPSSPGQNPDVKEDNVNTTENVENENAEIHMQTQTKRKKKFGSTQRPHGRQEPHAEGEDEEFQDPENKEEIEHHIITQIDTSNLITESQNINEVSCDIHDSTLTIEQKEMIETESEIGTGVINTPPAILSPEVELINTVVLNEGSSVSGVSVKEEAESTLLNEQKMLPIITTIQNDAFTEHVSLPVKLHGNERADDEYASEVRTSSTSGPVELIPQTHSMSDIQINTENIHAFVSDQNQNSSLVSEEHLGNSTNRESEPEQCDQKNKFEGIKEKEIIWEQNMDQKDANIGVTEEKNNDTKEKINTCLTENVFKEDITPVTAQQNVLCEVSSLTTDLGSTSIEHPSSTGENPDFNGDKANTTENVENKNAEDHMQTQTKKKKKFGSTRRPNGRQQPQTEEEGGEWKDPENTEEIKHQIISQPASSNLLTESENTTSEVLLDIHDLPLTMEQKETIKSEVEIWTGVTGTPPAILSPEADHMNIVVLDQRSSVEGLTDVKGQNETPGVSVKDDAESTLLNEQEMAPIITKIHDDGFAAVKEHGKESTDANEVSLCTTCGPVELTVVSDEGSSIKGFSENKEYNEKTGVNEVKDAESTVRNEHEMAQVVTKIHNDAFTEHVSLPVKKHGNVGPEDEHAKEVNAYTTCGPVELIPQAHTMSDMQMNTENILAVVSDQNQNISEEHLENLTNKETEPEQYESMSPFVQIQELKSSQVDEIKETVELFSSEKKRKMGSTRKSLRGQIPGSDQKDKFQAIKETENLQEQTMDQKDTNTGFIKKANNNTKEGTNAGLTENVGKEDITSVCAQQYVICEVSSLSTDRGSTTIEHPVEQPECKEDDGNSIENVDNTSAEIHIEAQTKKKKKFGSTRRPQRRQQPHAEGDDGEWKDPENTEENEHQIITQAATSNLLTEPQNTASEVSLDIHDSTLTMEQKEMIKSVVEIGTGVIEASPVILSPVADQINTVVLDDVRSVEGLTDVKEQNEKPGDTEDEHAESALLNEQEITPMITELHGDAFAAVKEHSSESHDDEHASEVNAYTTCVPVELIPETHTMSDLQMNIENIHVIVSDQNLNLSEEHLENPTNRESELEQYGSTSPFVQIQGPKSSQVDAIKENVEFISSEKRRKMGSTRRSHREPGIEQKNKFQEIKEKVNIHEQNMDQKDTKTEITEEGTNAVLTENVGKEDITSVCAQQYLLCEASSLTTDLALTTIKHPTEHPKCKEDDGNSIENVDNTSAEIHIEAHTKKKKNNGSTRKPERRQQPHAEEKAGEWKDPENTETEHQVITQAATSNLLTEPQNTASEVSVDIHDSTSTMEQKEMIKSEVEIGTGVIDASSVILLPEVDQIKTVILHDVSSVEELTEIKEQNENPGDTGDEHAESALLNEQEITPMITELHGDAFAAVKKHSSESVDDEHASEVNAYTTCGPVELIPETHTMSDLQMNTENIHVIVSDQNLNISEEHLDNPTNRDSEPEQNESTSPFVQIQEPKSSQVDVIKENVDFISSEKRRKMGSTRRSRREPGIEQKNKFQEIKEKVNIHEQNMDQKDTKTEITEEGTNAVLTENVGKEDITSVCAQQYLLCEASSLTTDLASTTIKHPTEHPECKEDDGNSIENVDNTSAEIFMEAHTKKKKNNGSTRTPQRRQQPHAEGEEGEWKDPENTETEHQVITQAATSNLLTEPQNTASEVPVDIHDSTSIMELKEIIKSKVEIRTGVIDASSVILSPEADQIKTVILHDISSVERLTEIKEQNEKPGDTEDEHAESALLNEHEITPMITELHGDAFAAVKEHVSESVDDEHASEVNAYTTCVPVELIHETHTMSDLQMNTENIHVIVSDQNLNISEEHLENPTNRELELEQYESTSPFVQIQEPKSSQVDVIKENVEFSSSEKRRKMGSTRRSLRGPGIEQKNKFQEIKEKENLQEQDMEQKDTSTGVIEEEINDTKEKINADLTENVNKEDITPVSAEQNVLCEVSSLTTDLGFTIIEHPSSAGENPDFKEDNVNTTENVENENAEIHTQTQTKKKKKFGSTRRPQRRQQPHVDGEDREWKDPENSEENEHQVITQAATLNLLTEPQNTASEVSLDIHDSTSTMEQKEIIKSEVEIRTGVINASSVILSPDADQIKTVILHDVSSVEELTEIKEQNEKPGDTEDEHAESALLNEQEIKPMITELHGDAFAAVKEHVSESVDDEHASEVNAYTTCVPMELIPETHTMSDLQMNTENIHVIVSDQNLNISEEHLENPTNRESEQYESTSLFVQIQEPKSSQVDVIKENVEFSSSEKRRKMGSTRRSLRGPGIEQKNKFQEIKEKENLQEQDMEQKDTSTGVIEEEINDTKEKINADLTENVNKEDITPVSAEQNVLCEVSSLTTDLGFTTIEHPSSAGENPDFKEDNVNTTENVENENAEIHMQSQTKKKKKFGSTRRPYGRQTLHAEGEGGEWKDPENTEENEHQIITQADTSHLLTDPHNTISEVSLDIHDSTSTMEQKEIIKSEVEIRTGVINASSVILSPDADQIKTVILHDVSSVEELTEIKEQNEKPGDNEDEHAESGLLNKQEITPMITELHGDAFAAVKEHSSESVDDEHASEVNAYTTCVPVELIPKTHTMSDLQMNTKNIHVIVSDQNLNISEEHLENPTNRESEPEQYESTSPFVQIQEPKSSQVDAIKENVEFSSSEKRRKMGSTHRSLRGPGIKQKNKCQEIKEKENLQEQDMEQKDTSTGVIEEENNDTKEKINADLTENVIKEDITPVSAEQNVLCEVSSLTTDLGFTTIEHPSSAGENPDFKKDNVNTTENVENENAEIHTQTQTKKKKKFGSTRRPQRRQQPHAEGDDGEWKDPENSEENEHQVITQAATLNLLTDPHNTTSEVSLDIHDSTSTMEQKEIIKSEVEIRTGVINASSVILLPEVDQIKTVVLHDVSSVEGLTEIKEQNEKPGDTEDEHAESALLNEQEIKPMITELHGDAFAAVKEHVSESVDDEHASEVNAYTTCVPVELIPETHTMSDLQMNTENIHVIVSDQNLNISEEHLENPTNREPEPEKYESTSPFVQIQEPKSSQVDAIKENVEFSRSGKRRKMGSTRRSLRGPGIEQKNKFQEIKEKENLQEQDMEQKDTSTGVIEEENNDTKEKINADLTENIIKEDITPVSAEQNVLCEVSSLTTDLGFTTIEHSSSAGENPDFKEDNVNTTENVENENAEIHMQSQTKKKKKFGSTRRPYGRHTMHAEGEDGECKDPENTEEIEHHIITASSNLLTDSQNTITEVSVHNLDSPLTVEQNETIKSEVEIGTESESELNESTSPFLQIQESKSSHVDVIKANVEFSGSEKRRKMGSTRKNLRGQITGSDQKNKFQEIKEKENIQEQNKDQKYTNTENTKEENNDKKEETNAGLTENVPKEDIPVNAQQYVLCEVSSLTTDLGSTTIEHPSSATEHPEFKEVDENSIDNVKNEKAEIQTQIQTKKKKKFGSTRRAQGRLQPHEMEGKLNDMEDTEEMPNSDLNFFDTKTRKQEYEPPIHNTLDQSECSLLSEIELYLNKSFESTLNTSGLNPNISEFSDPMSDGSLQLPSSQSSQIHMEQSSPSRRRKMGSSRKMTRNRHAEKVCDESRGSEQEKENLDNNNAKHSDPKSEAKTVKETVIAEGIEDMKQSLELMPEVQALSQLNESSTQATEPFPEVRRKFGSRRKVKGTSHLGAFTNGDNENKTEVTKDELRVSDPFYMSEPESTQIFHPASEPRPGTEEVKEAVGKDTHASTEVGLVSLHTIRKTSPGFVSTAGRPKIDFDQWNEQIPDFEQAVYNVVMVGNSNVGKTSFIKRLQNGHFIPDYSATIGVDTFVQTVTFGSRTVKLYVWDTAGQERYHSITKQVFHKAQGLLLMYDITSSQSFQAVRAWISQVQEKAPPDVILMLLGNKNDRTDREVQLKEGEDLSKEYDIDFMECSAVTGENVLESLKTLAWLLVKQRVRKEEEHTTLQPKPQNKKKSGCC